MSNNLKNRVPTQSETVAVAMSGGVDSAVALYLAKQTAGKVFGITAIMTEEESRCCSTIEVEGAASVAAALGVEHHIVEVKKTFKKEVIDYFCDDYLAGRTPSPCVKCNSFIKFGELVDIARELGADKLATGHYARVAESENGSTGLYRGADPKKDQSYFLAMLRQDQIDSAYFPVGNMTKADVRAIVAEAGLPVQSKGESQEVCFVMEGTHGNWIDVRTLQTQGAGDIVDLNGKKLGRHAGIHHYTIGQRRGLGVAAPQRLFVVKIDKGRNEVVLGVRDDAMSRAFNARELSWIGGEAPGESFDCESQIRYGQDAAKCSIRIDADSAAVECAEPQFGVAPGQLAAFYDGDRVLGGGWIC